jgi:transposase-like protein
MNCPHCTSLTTKEQRKKTVLGYRTFRCSACQRIFNERTGTPFNFLEYPTDIVLLVVRLSAAVQAELALYGRDVPGGWLDLHP